MGWGDWLKLGSDVEKEYQKQKKLGDEFKKAKAAGSGTKRGIRDKYGGYGNLALDANKLATGEKGGYGVGGRKMAKFDAYKFKDKRNIDINEMLKQDKII
jgi:hypothetical protein